MSEDTRGGVAEAMVAKVVYKLGPKVGKMGMKHCTINIAKLGYFKCMHETQLTSTFLC